MAEATIRGKFCFRVIVVMALGVTFTTSTWAQKKSKDQNQRPLTPADLSRLESLGDGFGNVGLLSPDGAWFAYTIQRPKAGNFHQEPFLGGGDRSDIYVVSTLGGDQQNLTHGERDGSGSWSPVWSPDSKHIAFISTRGEGERNARLWVCEANGGRARKLTDGAIDLIGAHFVVWLSDHEVVAVALPEGEQPLAMSVEMQTGQIAMEQWPKSWKGEEATPSVLQSGIPAETASHPQDRLVLIDLEHGEKTIRQAPAFSDLLPSPSGNYIALLEQTGLLLPAKGHLARANPSQYSLLVLDRDGNVVNEDLGKEIHILHGSPKWSADGSELALAPDPSDVHEGGAPAWKCRIADGKCEQMGLGLQTAMSEARVQDANPAPFAWSSHNSLLLFAKEAGGKRSDWWLVSPGAEKTNITRSLTDDRVPGDLLAEVGSDAMIGVADGHVWRISIDGGATQDLTPHFGESPAHVAAQVPAPKPEHGADQKITSIVWPKENTAEAAAVSEVIVGGGEGKSVSLYRLTLANAVLKILPKPTDFATLAGHSQKSGALVFSGGSRNGDWLWLTRKDSDKFSEVVHLNSFLDGVAEGAMKLVDYNSLDGKPLKAWLILPINYKQGVKYPMITWVYAGSLMSEWKEPFLSHLNDPISLNMQLFAQRGYAVLFPSMPLSAEGVTSDPMLDLTNGVLPAVDKVVEMGIADSDRVGLMGQSYGGFSTYGLITQTHRFKAAAALAGLSDLFSLYGQFDARMRYAQFPQENIFMMWLFENGQARMGHAPWDDLGRYLRNSPIFYVGRVDTPLLIIQGDMDYVAMQQGEEFFNALYRQGKRAEFVRYWGEGHVLESPANIEDMWQRLFSWFDEMLAPPKDGPEANTGNAKAAK
jgi:dipeptidyl aminopeptidase/acylaminoacyl peptidase